MKKFVIASNHGSLYLTDAHIEWLHNNGYPDADALFSEDDRSNPVLVACVEAIHASMKPLVETATSMIQVEEECDKKAKADKEKLSAAIDNFVEAVRAAGVRRHKTNIILALRRPGFENMPWSQAYCHFNRTFGVTVDNAKDAYEEYLRCMNSPAIYAMQEAHRAVEEYCEANGLLRKFQTVEINDGFVVKTFDETRFTAKAVSASNEEYEGYHPSYWEEMVLTPYLTRATVDSFVAEGNTDGLMEYLRSLHLNLNIEA